jgi:hypothetical protein
VESFVSCAGGRQYSHPNVGLLPGPRNKRFLPDADRLSFKRHSNDEPREEAFKFRRGQYFWQTRAAIGQAAARAVAQRVQVAEHTLRRRCVHPSMPDDLAFLATVPSGV